MTLRKDGAECRHCKTDRGPPYFGMSFRHVPNFVRNSYIDYRYHPSLDSKKHQQLKFWHLKTLNFFQGAALLNDVAALLNEVPLPPGVAHMPPPAVPASPTLAQRNVGYQVSRLATGKQEAGGFWSKGPWFFYGAQVFGWMDVVIFFLLFFWKWFVTLPETNITPENGPGPKRKGESLPTIHFQVRAVSFRECSCKSLGGFKVT